jgi:hypothetical protein
VFLRISQMKTVKHFYGFSNSMKDFSFSNQNQINIFNNITLQARSFDVRFWLFLTKSSASSRLTVLFSDKKDLFSTKANLLRTIWWLYDFFKFPHESQTLTSKTEIHCPVWHKSISIFIGLPCLFIFSLVFANEAFTFKLFSLTNCFFLHGFTNTILMIFCGWLWLFFNDFSQKSRK